MAFADFPEQRLAAELLQRSLERGRLSHAYLFSGTSLHELEEVALTMAKALNCQNPPARGQAGLPLDSCDRCSSCQRIQSENHPDIQWVRPESKSRVITIDQMRELMQVIYLKPTEASFKVAVLVAADRLNVQAANAFLKTLEEPPKQSIIILLTTEPSRILETILSRCLRLNFAGEGSLSQRDEAPEWIASFGRLAAGDQKGLLGRYRLLDVLLSQLAKVKEETEKTVTARSPLERHTDVDSKLRDKWEDELVAAIEAEYRRVRSEVVLALQWWLRDVWLQTLSIEGPVLSFPSLREFSRTVAGRLSPDLAVENIEVMERTQRLLNTNVQEALALEVGLLKLKI